MVLRLRFQPPPPGTEHADFLHSALLPALGQGLCDLPVGNGFVLDYGAKTDSTFSIPFSLPLAVDPLTRVLQITGRSYHFASAFLFRQRSCGAAGVLRSLGITPVRRHCEPIRHRLAFKTAAGEPRLQLARE